MTASFGRRYLDDSTQVSATRFAQYSTMSNNCYPIWSNFLGVAVDHALTEGQEILAFSTYFIMDYPRCMFYLVRVCAKLV
jgi:hypothetical protein